METLRQVLAFPVYATVAWLVWVLGQQVGPAGLFAALVGLVLVGLAAWSFNAAQAAGGWGRRLATGALAAALAGLAVAVVAPGARPGRPGWRTRNRPPRPATSLSRRRGSTSWSPPHRPVFVNMTAAWCITCLVNERAALSTKAVQAAFAAKDVAYLKGDWTSRNPEITRLLEKHGRSGVPLYLLYTGRRRAHRLAADSHACHSPGRDRPHSRSGRAPGVSANLSQGVSP